MDSPGAAEPQPNSRFLGAPRTCRDGPPGRLYGALPSPGILAQKTKGFGLVVRMENAIVRRHLGPDQHCSGERAPEHNRSRLSLEDIDAVLMDDFVSSH